MNCYFCHGSKWMQWKALGFLRNLLDNFKGTIEDNDIFRLLDFPETEKLLEQLLDKPFYQGVLKKFKERHGEQWLEYACTREILQTLWNDEKYQYLFKKFLPALFEKAFATPWENQGQEDIFHNKIVELQSTLKLTDREIDILMVALAMQESLICEPFNRRGDRPARNIFMMSKCLNVSESVILASVTEQKPLRRFNCLDSDLDFNGWLLEFLYGLTDDPLASCYYAKVTDETLPWSDFTDLTKKHGAILKRMLTSGHKPANILLYGTPGTGKTSFARTLAKEIGRTCYAIAQNLKDRDRNYCSSPDFRFGALQVCDGQVIPEDSLIIVDEADDMLRGLGRDNGFFALFGGAQSHKGDKGLLNSVLDTMKTSTIWITNTPAGALDESSRRRFDYSICFQPLDSEQRRHIWKNNIARLKLGRLVSSRQVEEFSSLYPVSAGGISLTLENLARMQPRKAEVPRLIEQLMKPHCELLGVKLADDKLLPSKDYSLEGLNIQGDVKLERIVEAIRAFQRQKGDKDPDRPRMNLLLAGAPGTGKTEFVKYLGDVLKTKVNVKMGSDLLSMWVGGTEKNIASAFREAEAEHAILFLDELDGLVQSRTLAQRSWEVTQVNELLHQMENFDGVMIGATNFLQNLDQAIMRRFTFKLQFNFLDDEGKRIFFERMFKTTLTDDELQRLQAIPNLAPGDFRTARQSLFYYGGEITNARRLEALEHESSAKDGSAFATRGKLGF